MKNCSHIMIQLNVVVHNTSKRENAAHSICIICVLSYYFRRLWKQNFMLYLFEDALNIFGLMTEFLEM